MLSPAKLGNLQRWTVDEVRVAHASEHDAGSAPRPVLAPVEIGHVRGHRAVVPDPHVVAPVPRAIGSGRHHAGDEAEEAPQDDAHHHIGTFGCKRHQPHVDPLPPLVAVMSGSEEVDVLFSRLAASGT